MNDGHAPTSRVSVTRFLRTAFDRAPACVAPPTTARGRTIPGGVRLILVEPTPLAASPSNRLGKSAHKAWSAARLLGGRPYRPDREFTVTNLDGDPVTRRPRTVQHQRVRGSKVDLRGLVAEVRQ